MLKSRASKSTKFGAHLMHWILTYFFKKNTSTMSVSAAISSANFEALEQAVTGKDNEVFSTILFDSYDDKRIEELLLLEAMSIIEQFKEKTEDKETVIKTLIALYSNKDLLNLFKLENKSSSSSGSWGSDSTKYYEYKWHDEIIFIDYCYHRSDGTTNSYIRGLNIDLMKSHNEYTKPKTVEIDLFNLPGNSPKESREFLLKRICERHAMNETLVQSMKKKLEIERLYYKMKDLYDEDVKLTRTINSKHEQLNSLQEDICAKKVELNQLDMRILQAQNDLEALAYHHKQMELATEINNEVTLLEDDKEALDAKRMHDYYINFANDLKVYKFAFEHMREISMKLEQEKKDFEEYKTRETKELEDEVSIITYEIKKKREDFDEEIKKKQYEFEEEIKRKQEKFDEDCEAYEEESTKWKSMQESKFAKYQRQIDNYDYVVDERDRLEREVEKLNKELKSVTNERDRYRTTIETLSSFRK